MEGVVLKLEEARGMIPRHPFCKCAWVPANVGESGAGQKDTQSSIRRAVRVSVGRAGDDWGPGVPIRKRRPEGIV
jgi:hypothetical protein